ncbi:MAG: 16S rRNA (adenine(1518)-N(6)/adenine(1519)-N(6))-dimethyltransferase RsmA [Candidatus Omnitrophica bacterium]|nr:16S rRNA (adenine(1518)-N(6)/adenine(1519)-N(6))-dimethyltransferase RsmA [Candidatus Omnitrophota bacterium]
MQIKPKKSLGQNFLIDKNIQGKIISACQLKPDDTVLEIGAGRGELTKIIAKQVNKVLALEIDHHLCASLKDNLRGYGNVKVINQDILSFKLRRHLLKLKNKINIVGNIPYYITTPIIEYLLKYPDKIESIILTVQKEFAKRIVSGPGPKEYGSFSCFVQYYAMAKILFYVKNTCFFPTPKVDSAVLELKIRPEPSVKVENEKMLFKIIRTAFNKRRKILKNSLKGIIPQQKLELFFKEYHVNPNIRPEELSLQDFANLANI